MLRSEEARGGKKILVSGARNFYSKVVPLEYAPEAGLDLVRKRLSLCRGLQGGTGRRQRAINHTMAIPAEEVALDLSKAGSPPASLLKLLKGRLPFEKGRLKGGKQPICPGPLGWGRKLVVEVPPVRQADGKGWLEGSRDKAQKASPVGSAELGPLIRPSTELGPLLSPICLSRVALLRALKMRVKR